MDVLASPIDAKHANTIVRFAAFGLYINYLYVIRGHIFLDQKSDIYIHLKEKRSHV